MSNHKKLVEFHDTFDVPVGKVGYLISPERALLRVRLMNEELAELVEAMQLGQYVNIGAELIDLLYVVYGTGVEYGLPVDEIFAEIHRANMTKTSSTDAGGKVTKGDNYVAPNVRAILDKALRKGME